MPTPAQLNTEDIRELKASNQRVADRIDRLAEKIDETNRLLVEFKGRTEAWLSVAKWGVGAVVLGFTTIGGLAVATSREVARIDAKLTAYERTSESFQVTMEKLTRAIEGGIPRLNSSPAGKVEGTADPGRKL